MGKDKDKTERTGQAQPGAANDDAQAWYLLVDDGSIYGPVDMPTLKVWAQQGRIAPGYKASLDRHDWIPTEKIDELELFWSVELSDGTVFGPLNLHALADLIRSGSVPRETKLVNIRTGATSTVQDQESQIFASAHAAEPAERRRSTPPSEVGEATTIQGKIQEFEKSLKRTMGLLKAQQADLEKERAALAEARNTISQRDATLEAAATEHQRQEALLREAAEREQALAAEVDRMALVAREHQERAQALLSEHEDVHHRLQQTDQSLQTALDQLREADRRHQATGAELESTRQALRSEQQARVAMQRQVTEIQQRLDQSAAEMRALNEALTEAQTAVEQSSTQFQEQQSQLEERLARTHESARRYATDVEQLRAQLLTAENDLADRESLRQNLDGATNRIAELEAENAGLREERQQAANRYLAEFEDARHKIDDLQRSVEDFERLEVVTPELVRETPPAPAPEPPSEDEETGIRKPPKRVAADLADLEAQAQRELREWQRSFRRK